MERYPSGLITDELRSEAWWLYEQARNSKAEHIKGLVKQLDPDTRTEFIATFGDKVSAIADLDAAAAWLTTKVEPF